LPFAAKLECVEIVTLRAVTRLGGEIPRKIPSLG